MVFLRASMRGEVTVLNIEPGPERVSDADLVERARGGDEFAIETIYRRHVHFVAGIAARLLRGETDVEDVVQETFLLAYEKLDQLIDPGALRAWLAQIALSRVHRRYRWRRMASIWSGADPRASLHEQASLAASPEQRAELALIDGALARVPLKLRTPWVLRHVLGSSLDEVARACGCSLATAKRRLAKVESIVRNHVGAEAT